ncbi:hypothetical protein BDZ91DRAFT_765009 [Kalaharituber pfeilii]|nr:hypothetical protein BDZ91DRAFT_765009 [Kalaharituber pfeilii]
MFLLLLLVALALDAALIVFAARARGTVVSAAGRRNRALVRAVMVALVDANITVLAIMAMATILARRERVRDRSIVRLLLRIIGMCGVDGCSGRSIGKLAAWLLHLSLEVGRREAARCRRWHRCRAVVGVVGPHRMSCLLELRHGSLAGSGEGVRLTKAVNMWSSKRVEDSQYCN